MNYSQSSRALRCTQALLIGSVLGGALLGCGVQIVTSPPQAIADANVARDGGRDAGNGGGADAGSDTGSDAGSDAGIDAFMADAFVADAGVDAFRPDAFRPDTGADAFMPDAFMATDAGPPPGFVDLRSAHAFAILAGSTVSSTGFTMITGDIGISPGTALIGFPPATVVGSIHAGDSVAAQAMIDLTTAYNDAMARSLTRMTVSGNIGGQTLAPGLYTSGSSLAISSGDLTLDGGGNVNAVWIFQTGSTLTMTAGRQVFLTGGAIAANVYWQISTSATIGTNAVIAGNILADQSITLDTGATLNGRALTRIGAVTLDAAIVIRPFP